MLSVAVFIDEVQLPPAAAHRPAVAFRLPEYPTVLVRAPRRDDLAPSDDESGTIHFGSGKSCLLEWGTAAAEEASVALHLYVVDLHENDHIGDGFDTRGSLVASAACQLPLQPAAAAYARVTLELRDLVGNAVGTLHARCKAVALGQTIAPHVLATMDQRSDAVPTQSRSPIPAPSPAAQPVASLPVASLPVTAQTMAPRPCSDDVVLPPVAVAAQEGLDGAAAQFHSTAQVAATEDASAHPPTTIAPGGICAHQPVGQPSKPVGAQASLRTAPPPVRGGGVSTAAAVEIAATNRPCTRAEGLASDARVRVPPRVSTGASGERARPPPAPMDTASWRQPASPPALFFHRATEAEEARQQEAARRQEAAARPHAPTAPHDLQERAAQAAAAWVERAAALAPHMAPNTAAGTSAAAPAAASPCAPAAAATAATPSAAVVAPPALNAHGAQPVAPSGDAPTAIAAAGHAAFGGACTRLDTLPSQAGITQHALPPTLAALHAAGGGGTSGGGAGSSFAGGGGAGSGGASLLASLAAEIDYVTSADGATDLIRASLLARLRASGGPHRTASEGGGGSSQCDGAAVRSLGRRPARLPLHTGRHGGRQGEPPPRAQSSASVASGGAAAARGTSGATLRAADAGRRARAAAVPPILSETTLAQLQRARTLGAAAEATHRYGVA